LYGLENHELFSVGLYIYYQHNEPVPISGNNTKQVLHSKLNELPSLVTDLQDGIVMGTNVAVGLGTFTALTRGTSNVAVGSRAAGRV